MAGVSHSFQSHKHFCPMRLPSKPTAVSEVPCNGDLPCFFWRSRLCSQACMRRRGLTTMQEALATRLRVRMAMRSRPRMARVMAERMPHRRSRKRLWIVLIFLGKSRISISRPSGLSLRRSVPGLAWAKFSPWRSLPLRPGSSRAIPRHRSNPLQPDPAANRQVPLRLPCVI